MHGKKIYLLLLAVLMLTTGCKRPAPALFRPDTYPRVDGSTVTLPLSIDMAAHLMQISREEAQERITHNRTHEAYVSLIEQKTDLILVTHPSEDELALAALRNVELEVVPVVRDAFVFLVNRENPVDSLTLSQIQEIYQGNTVNWSQVGGEDKAILAYQRPRNSGSQTLMESLVMQGLPMAEAPVEMIPADMGMLVERVAGYDNADRALGYSVYYYANSMYNHDTMKFLGVNGIPPQKDTIAAESYPLTISYYAVLRKAEPENSPARRLLAWLLSEEGQALAETSGYVPLR
jgi:phosphate transport system substrate-binding protein